ncbi:CD302 antigen-like [Mytilus californianus]|uniref:CD302 antigen-like n=1 Tax=Mytilus californianus TaxID=6549 RepID=UPI002247E8A0|nr:CD302 antigen-like [Mytilus californianus]
MKCNDGVLTTDDNLSCMEGYTSIVYATSVCLNQTIEDTICVPDDTNDATLRFFGSSKYLFVRNITTVPGAKNSCSRVCGSLVEINNEEKNTFLATTAEEFQIGTLLIGLEHNGEEFVWLSGNSTDAYDNWDPAENFESTCVYLGSGNTKWNTFDCIGLTPFVCEIRDS